MPVMVYPINGRNVTGDYAHSFAIVNEADHDILFSKRAFDGPIAAGTYIDYWRLKPGTTTLMWPGQRYYASLPDGLRTWNASPLPNVTKDFAAFLAESIMYNYLAPLAPIAT